MSSADLQMKLAEPGWALAVVSGKGKRKDQEGAEAVVGAAKKKAAVRGEASRESVHKELVTILAKLCLTNAAEIRDISGVVYITYLAKKDSSVCSAMKEAGVKYDSAVQGNPTHSLGPPFLHVWTAMIRAMIQLQGMADDKKGILVKYWQENVVTKTMEELVEAVKYCRLKRTQKQEIVKVQYSITAEAERCGLGDALRAAWKQEEAELKVGPAPRGILEREARRLLQKVD